MISLRTKMAKLNLKKYTWLMAFLISSVTMFLILSYSGVLSNGKYCLLEGDLLEIYVPTIHGACRDLLTGESIYYSWNHSLGMNMSLSLAYYGVFSPFTLLYLVFFNADLSSITALIIIIKAGLAALFFQLCVRYVFKVSGLQSVLFAVLYSTCSFQVSYNLVNFIWMDAIYMFPLIILSMYYFANKGRILPLCISYSYLFIVQFYMGYIAGVISFLFFIGSIWFLPRCISVRKYIIGYFFSVVSAILFSAIVWAPAAYFLLHQHVNDATSFSLLKINIIDVLNQLFFSNNSSIYGSFPNIYSGIATIILTPLYILQIPHVENKQRVERIILVGILSLLLLACVFTPLYSVLHAFDAPDGWQFRFSWLISFFMCVLSSKSFEETKKIGISFYLWLFGFSIAVYVVEIYWLKGRFPEETVNTGLFLVLNIVLICIWSLLLMVVNRVKQEKRESIILLCILVAALECIGNGYSAYYKSDDKTPGMPEYVYKSYISDQKNTKMYLSRDPGFFRVNYIGSSVTNIDSLCGFNGIADFDTSENPRVRDSLSKLGMATSPRLVETEGMTEVSEMVLGVKYRIIGTQARLISTFDQEIVCSETKYPLSLGYMTSEEIKDVTFSKDAFLNNNALVSAMTGKEITIYNTISKDCISVEGNGIIIEQIKDGTYRFISTNDQDADTIRFRMKGEDNNHSLYMYFVNETSVNRLKSMMIIGEEELLTEDGGTLSMSYIKKCDVDEDGQYVEISAEGQNEQYIEDYKAAFLDIDKLEEAYKELSQNQLELTDFKNGYIKGSINVTNEKRVLFTTIPYDEGWKLKINGKESKYIPLLNGGFIGIELPAEGRYEIEMEYSPGWLKEGFLLSGIGVTFILGYLVGYLVKVYSMKKREEHLYWKGL